MTHLLFGKIVGNAVLGRKLEASDITARLISGAQSESGTFEA
jgi:hypothetical protein